jgi:hypothetical protein
MKVIETSNDDHVFQVTVKNKGIIFIDGFELASRCAEIPGVDDGNAKATDIAQAVSDVGWSESQMSSFNSHELFSVGSKVLVAIENMGKS